jgi:hypothetical protein
MKMNKSNSTNDKEIELILFRLKIFYWFIALSFSIVFIYFSGIDLREKNILNNRVEAIILGLIFGSILIYYNIFHTGYAFGDRIISSFIYIFCLFLMAYIYKPLLYDSSSYTIIGRLSLGNILPVIYMIAILGFFIWKGNDS